MSAELDDLIAAASLCWAAPATVRVAGGAAGRPGPGAAPGSAPPHVLAEFVPIPSAHAPKLLVPVERRAAATAVARYSHSLGRRERVVRGLLSAGLRTGLVQELARTRVQVVVPTPAPASSGSASLPAFLAEVLGQPVSVSLGVGTARANRKPVLQAVARSGRALAFVKLGDSDLTRGLLRHEAAALQRLAEGGPAGMRFPRLLHLGTWNGLEVLVQSALTTPWFSAGRPDEVPVAAITALSRAFDGGELPLASTPLWARLTAAVGQVQDDARRARFAAALAEATASYGDVVVSVGAWHGDFTPWNIAWTRRGLHVWDWERFDEGVPVGFDALHYAGSLAADRCTWSEVLTDLEQTAAAYTASVGVARSQAAAVARAYLVELCRRYLLAAQPPGGDPLRERTDGLLAHLTRGLTLDPLPPWHGGPASNAPKESST